MLKRFIQVTSLRIHKRWYSRNVIDVLRERGLIQQVSQPEDILVKKLTNGEKIKLYCGADPTAKSLHIGNLLPLIVLLHFYVRGHNIVTLVGGATGKIGDPSGRKTERSEMNDETRLDNESRIAVQLKQFFENGLKYYESRVQPKEAAGIISSTNNHNWWHSVKLLDFLGQYGRHIRIQPMLNRDSVSSRLDGQNGLGFNEFTYQILQAYDFYYLYKSENVSVQVGGNDQWGNITAGIDFINRVLPESKKDPPFGITVPLLTTSTGEKFGKSAGNAVFIDPKINTPFDMYQVFINTPDQDVLRFLKIFTLLPMDTIDTIMNKHNANPHLRLAQKTLAFEVVDLVHGIGKGQESEHISKILFGQIDKDTNADKIMKLFHDANILQETNRKTYLSDLLSQLLECSKSEAKRKLGNGAIYLGVERIRILDDINDYSDYLLDDKVLIIRIGKQKCYIVKMI